MDGDLILRIAGSSVDDAICYYDDPFREDDGFCAGAFRDELVSESCLGICEAMSGYDDGCGAKLTTFAYLVGYRDAMDFLRKEYRIHKGRVSMESPRVSRLRCEDDDVFDLGDLSDVLSDVELCLVDGVLCGDGLASVGRRLSLDSRKVYEIFKSAKVRLADYVTKG